jgi:hypothetical protein
LYDYIKYCKAQGIKILYCDTDSIFTNKPLPDAMTSKTELGKLKLEKEFSHGLQLMGLKNYAALDVEGNIIIQDREGIYDQNSDSTLPGESRIIKGEEWKLKGISKNAVMIDKNTFIQQEWRGIGKQQYYVRWGRKPGEYWIIYVKKEIKQEIKKGRVKKDGNITPFQYRQFI